VSWKTALILVALAFGRMLAAAAADDGDGGRFDLVNLLDPDKPLAERKAVFTHYQEQALAGDTSDQYIVGSLYRIGARLGDNVVDRDPDTAGRYLSTAAAHGYVHAMAKMAEIELAAKRPLEAMIWAQLYGHYSLDVAEGATADKGGNGYYAGLLQRVYAVFDGSQQDTMLRDLNAFIAAHDADIRDGLARNVAQYQSGTMREKISMMHYDSMAAKISGRRNDDLAEYLIAFAPDGHAEQAWMLDAMPDIALGRELRTVALRVRVNAGSGPGLRYALVPIQYSFGRYALRNKH
jgi:hypothetical protein